MFSWVSLSRIYVDYNGLCVLKLIKRFSTFIHSFFVPYYNHDRVTHVQWCVGGYIFIPFIKQAILNITTVFSSCHFLILPECILYFWMSVNGERFVLLTQSVSLYQQSLSAKANQPNSDLLNSAHKQMCNFHSCNLVMSQSLVFCLNNRSYLKQWLEMIRSMILLLMT